MRINIINKIKNKEWLFLSAIVVIGAILRIKAQAHLMAISPDGLAYISHAFDQIEGMGSFERRGPLFQLLLIFVYKISEVNLQSSVFFPLLFGSILPIIFFFIGKHFFESRVGLVAALLYSINPLSINLSCWVLRETLSLTLILTFILTVHHSLNMRSKKKSLAATILPAFLYGLLILTREEMIVVIAPAYVVYVLFNEKKNRYLLARMLIFLIVTLLTITPWLLYSNVHFGNPFYSYSYYVESHGAHQATIDTPVTLSILYGLYEEINTLPNILSLLGLAFLSVGVMYTIKKRAIWIIFFVATLDFIILSVLFGSDWLNPQFSVPFSWNDISRIPYSAIFPLIIISAYGVIRFMSYLSNIGQKIIIPLPFNKIKIKLRVFIILIILIIGLIEYVPVYSLMLKDFDEQSSLPYMKSAEFVTSIGSEDGIFTIHPELLANYYNGSIYELPEGAGFQYILEESRIKGVKYLIIDSTSISSRELIRLYYHSVDESWGGQIPKEFSLVNTDKWKYGLYYLQPHTWFKGAIYYDSKWGANNPWKGILTTMGASITTFNETSSLLDIGLSEFDIVVFDDFTRPFNDSERLYLEELITKGLTVVVSGISPFFLSGGTSNLTLISQWFGANNFSEAPGTARWKVRFTKNATEVVKELNVETEYEFYTDSDWSTPTGCDVNLESTVYAYRVNDETPAIFSHKFGEGAVIFIGPRLRYTFASQDIKILTTFLNSLIYSSIQ